MPQPITLRELNRATLARQMLLSRQKVSALKAIERLAGLQAQEARPPFVGLWTRVEGFRRKRLAQLLTQRKVVRATMMRATLHLVATNDYIAWRPTVQPALDRAAASVIRGRKSEMDVHRLVGAATKFLTQGPQTFAEIRSHLQQFDVNGDARAMGYAVRNHLPMVQVPAEAEWSFPRAARFQLAESWIGTQISSDSNPRALVKAYLAAFGPATPADAQVWSGLGSLREVFEELAPRLRVLEDEDGRLLYDLPRAPRPAANTRAPVRLLPEFDNLIMAHDDRRRIVSDEHRPRICTKNLRVLPTFLVDGFAAGLWKTERAAQSVTLVFQPFGQLGKTVRSELGEEAEALLRFIEPEAGSWKVRFEKGVGERG